MSVLTHALGGLCILLFAGRLSPPHGTVADLLKDVPRLAWIAPDSGGRGNGQSSEQARPLQRPGQASVAIPAKAQLDRRTLEEPMSPAFMDVPLVPTSAGVQELPGTLTAIETIGIAQSNGTGNGTHAGSGRGPGDGSGNGQNGSGIGDGYRPGNGVTVPRLIREVKPSYTSDAMRARIQGMVRLQAIVSPDGSVSSARVIRSLDDKFGLDQEAVKTVKQWHFLPGTLAGRPVPVVIEVELTFTLR